MDNQCSTARYPQVIVSRGEWCNVQPRRVQILERTLCGALLSILCSFGILCYMLDTCLIPTSLVLVGVVCLGVFFIHQLAVRLENMTIHWVSFFYLLKIPVVLLLVFWAWVPELPLASAEYGYDPQRYYYQALDFLRPGSNYDLLRSLNYGGILYYYALIFAVSGHNPAAPALVNCLVTLLGTLVIIEAVYLVMPRGRSVIQCAAFILLPEILWYDAITARESLAAALFVCGTLPWGMLFLSRIVGSGSCKRLLFCTVSLIGLGLVRTSMLLPAAVIIIIFYVLFATRSKYHVLGIAGLTVVVLAMWLVPRVVTHLRGYDFNFLVAWRISREIVSGNSISWSDRSIGQVLVPQTVAQEVLFAPLRTLAYLILPLPSITFEWSGLVSGEWQDWQNFLTSLSSCCYFWFLPQALAGLWGTLARSSHRQTLVIHLPCWLALTAIGVGNTILVPRYRIMAMGFYWAACSMCSREHAKLLWVCRTAWWIGAIMLGVLYALFKF